MSLKDSEGADPGKQSLLWALPSLTGGWRGGTSAPPLFKGSGSDFREELLGNRGAPDRADYVCMESRGNSWGWELVTSFLICRPLGLLVNRWV